MKNTSLRCDSAESGIYSYSLRGIAKSKGLKIASLNVNSLLKHVDEIRILLAKYTFDILAINESKIDNSITDNDIHILGYNVIRKDRSRFGGGVVLYVRDNIPFSVRKDLTPDSLEMACIEINRPYNKSFLISAWYRPPNSDINLFDEWALFLGKCDSENKELIVLGDLNCNVSKIPSDLQTRKLQFLCSLYQIEQLINEPTRVTPTSAALIDLILTNKPEEISQSGVIHLGISDHSLVFAVRKFSLPKSGQTKVREVRDFKNFVENDFIQDVSQLPWDIVYQFDNPNICWQVWKSLFLEALDRHAPLRRKRLKENAIPWVTPQIKQRMRKRDFHKKQAVKHNSQTQWELYKTERNKVNIEMRKTKSKYFCEKIEDCTHSKDVKKSWSLINTILGRKRKSTNVKELLINNTTISDDEAIAESFNDYFTNIGMKLAAESVNLYSNSCDDPVNDERVDHCPDICFNFSDINVSSVALRLQNLKASKATGLDNIPAKVLKVISHIIAPSLTAIFSLSLNMGIYVDEWKLARLSPIYKSEDRRKCENYRPISILPIISKVFEREVFGQIYGYLNENSLLSKFQSGFRPKHGTLAALIQMCDQWLANMDNGKLNGVVFLDIRKAFDSINHEILLKKLKDQFGIHGVELKWFESYLMNRQQVCFVNGHTSLPKKMRCGIPQGSILGPLMFLLYVNDMPDYLKKTTPCLYADDTQISSASDDFDTLIDNLNYDLNNVQKWLSKNKLQHHPTKSKVMFIGSSYNLNNKVGDKPILLNNVPVSRTSTYTCLGVDIDEKLNWEKHVDTICSKVSAGIGAMRRVKPYVPPATLQTIYKSLVQPYFDYCSPLWDNCGKTLQEKLQKFQSRAARVITGTSYDVRSVDVLDTLGWQTLDVRRSQNKSIFMYKILNKHTAPNLNELFCKRNISQNNYNLRNSETDLSLPKPKTEFLKKGFGYSGAMLWNHLSQDSKQSETLCSFKRAIRQTLS